MLKVVKMSRTRFAMRDTAAVVDLTEIHRAILNDAHMRHPPLEELQRSYADGNAAVAMDGDRPFAFVRLVERLHAGLYGAVGLPQELPTVYEIGAGFVLQGYRGRGHYTPLRNYLLGAHGRAISNGSELVVGITNNVQVLNAVKQAGGIGISFGSGSIFDFHVSYQMVSQFFCNCSPQEGDNTAVMFTLPGCTRDGTSEREETPMEWDPNGTMPFYTVYWSNTRLMAGLNGAMESHFGDGTSETRSRVASLRSALRGIGYYS